MTNYEVAQAWWQGKSATTKHMLTDGTTIWSYGEHFPIAWRRGTRVYYNDDKYSNSTSQHQSYVRQVVESLFKLVVVNTSQLKRVVESDGRYHPGSQWWRTVLYRKLVSELATRGVTLLDKHGDRAQYGSLVAPVMWQYKPGNLICHSDYRDTTWLSARSSTPQVNKREPLFVRVDVAALLSA